MKKNSIIQFVGFVTNLGSEEFTHKWEGYANQLSNKKTASVLQEQLTDTKTKFRYISQHEWPDSDLQFSFMNERKSEHFPEHNVKVVQTGGYTTLQSKRSNRDNDGEIQVIAFISHSETDIEFYRQLKLYSHLNIHQAFYESCSFAYVMEFFVPENMVDSLIAELKQRPGIELGLYKECNISVS